MKNNKPNYFRIYNDILQKKFPQKIKECEAILSNNDLSVLDILEINKIIFGKSDEENQAFDQKHKSYHQSDILEILDYQKKHKLNNVQLALHFKLSRNTVTKWKKLYLV